MTGLFMLFRNDWVDQPTNFEQLETVWNEQSAVQRLIVINVTFYKNEISLLIGEAKKYRLTVYVL